MADLTITRNELLEALSLAAPGRAPENARTCEELALAAGVSRDVVNERIAALHRDGLVVVHTAYRPNVIGRMVQKPAYTFLTPKKRRA